MFKNILNQNERTFTVFDIQEFYPSVTKDLLKTVILFAQNSVNISPKSIEVVFHFYNSLLCHNGYPSIKKDPSEEFDVTMGSYDGAEVCEIVGLSMLDMLNKLFEKKFHRFIQKMVCQFSEIITVIRTIKLEKIL